MNDINESLMNFYRGIKTDFIRVKRELKKIEEEYAKNRKEFDDLKKIYPNDRVEDKNEKIYYFMRDIYNGVIDSEIHPATVYYFINKTAYSGMIRYNKKGKYNVPYGRYKNFNTELINEHHSELLNKTKIFSKDYKEIFDMSQEDDFIFLDPPYDCVFSDYGNIETKDGFTEDMHRKLAYDFKQLKCKALMAISKTPLIEELYSDYIVHEYEKSYSVNIRNRFKSEAHHVLICNYKEILNNGEFK
ncbi:DNA adenine methylase [Tuanshanicoccus yangjingiae]|uniref:DNA adenine methylase n=1 Tax=Aerococcaceae bacterium zg-252 TaxID=2796928 RepID=UPI0040646B86